MEDLAAALQNILSSPEGQQQLNQIKNMLGMQQNNGAQPSAGGQPSNGGQNPPTTSSPQQESKPSAGGQSSGGGGFDMSALTSMLNQLGGGAAQTASSDAGGGNSGTGGMGGGFDMSALTALLGNLSGKNAGTQPQNDAASLGQGFPNIDINMIMKLQQVFQSMNTNDKNSQLLLALKPHFGQRRQGKVDQAISMMRLFSMLPMLRESGLFQGL